MDNGSKPHVNDDDVEESEDMIIASSLSQLIENYSTYLRQVVAHIDNSWTEGMRPQLNALIHAMEKEVEVP